MMIFKITETDIIPVDERIRDILIDQNTKNLSSIRKFSCYWHIGVKLVIIVKSPLELL